MGHIPGRQKASRESILAGTFSLPFRFGRASMGLCLLVVIGISACQAPPQMPSMSAPAAVAGVQSASVSWTRPAGAIRNYRILTNGSRVTSCAKSPCLITGLRAGSRYAFKVDAVGVTGSAGPWSASSRTVIPKSPPVIPSMLRAGQTLTAGHSLRSPDGRYTLAMQTDGNLVVYNAAHLAMWNTVTFGTGGSNYLSMQPDGNLVVYKSPGVSVWSSGSVGYQQWLALQSDGNLVVYAPGGRAVWDYGSGHLADADTLTAAQILSTGQSLYARDGSYQAVMQPDGNFVVYGVGHVAEWSTQTGGTGTGNYLKMQADGNLVVYTAANVAVWNSHTNGTGTSNHVVMQTDKNLVVYSGTTARWSWVTGVLAVNEPGPTPADPASVTWARTHDGETYGTSAEQPAEAHQWSGFCWTFVFDAFGGSVPREATAQDGWDYYAARGMTHQGVPPAGSIAFYSYATDGHAAVAVGGGLIIGTHGTDTDREAVYETSYNGRGLPYLGYVIP
jgi:hypothetical protein